MAIGKDIQQRAFENEWHKLRVNLLFTAGWFRGQMTDFLKPFGITQQQFNILRILRGQHPDAISTLQIRERMIDKMSDASRLVDRLQKKGLLHKRPCDHDKRLVDVLISNKGLATLAEIDNQIGTLDRIGQGGLTEEEGRHLNALLDKMRVCTLESGTPV